MASAYVVGPINARQVERAYCLIEAVGYGIDLDAWRAICRADRHHRSPYADEIATVENSLGYVNGLAVMRARHSARLGLYLSVPVFVVVSAADAHGVSSAMLRYVTDAARGKRCCAVHIANLKADEWPVLRSPYDPEPTGVFIPLR